MVGCDGHINFVIQKQKSQSFIIMYYDLSLLPQNHIQLHHLLASMPTYRISSAAIDYQYADMPLPPLPASFAQIKTNNPQTTLYSRATLIIQQTSTLHQLNQPAGNNNSYDILAVRPKTQKLFHSVCVQYDNYDIISLDISSKLPFMLKRNPVYEALRKGKYFEIQYDPLFDDSTRVVCMTNIINIIKATQGKNIIVSSHSSSLKTHRTPYDVVALMSSLGMDKNRIFETMKGNAQSVVRGAMHRRSFKGTVRELGEGLVRKLGKRIGKHRERLRRVAQEKNKEKE